MKHLYILIMTVALMATGAMAADPHKGMNADTASLTGTIVDNLCAEAHKATLDEFIKTHTRECALMPKCAASGYSLYHYGALIRFDAASSKKIGQFLKKKGSRLDVEVVVKKKGDVYTLVSIKNR